MRRVIPLYCLMAGSCDAATGLLLVAGPGLALRLMRIAAVPAEPIYLRWIGVFVACVGLSYLYPFLYRGAPGREARLTVVLEVTVPTRLAVALFVGAGVLAGALSVPWLSVLFTDLVLAAVQLAMLKELA